MGDVVQLDDYRPRRTISISIDAQALHDLYMEMMSQHLGRSIIIEIEDGGEQA